MRVPDYSKCPQFQLIARSIEHLPMADGRVIALERSALAVPMHCQENSDLSSLQFRAASDVRAWFHLEGFVVLVVDASGFYSIGLASSVKFYIDVIVFIRSFTPTEARLVYGEGGPNAPTPRGLLAPDLPARAVSLKEPL